MKQSTSDVIVVGAGFAGLYLVHQLRALGFNVRVLEAGSGVGGTWYWNRYPGARCDVESMQYSYQFDDALQQEWDWSERYASQPEILRYAEHVADRFELRDNIEFNTRVSAARYDEKHSHWTLVTEQGQEFHAQFCILATGCLSVPNWPSIVGLDSFDGPVYHTAQWPQSPVDFAAQRVAVIGTGSSAIQSIPEIAKQAAQLTVFQRTANYSIPARNRPSDSRQTAEVKASYPALRARARQNFSGIDGVNNTLGALEVSVSERNAEYERRWTNGGLTFGGAFSDLLQSKEANDTAANFVRDKIRETVTDPEIAKALCPVNIIGGKRICIDTNYHTTYNLDHVSLVDMTKAPITSIEGNRVCTSEQEYEFDSLVIATGFDAMTGAINSIDIVGRNDHSLRSRWSNGPSTYLGLAMADFPNLFTVTGPGSPSVFTNMLPTIEQHVEWISECLAYTRDKHHRTIEAESTAEQDWWEHCQEVAAAGLKATTDSWYSGSNIAGKPKVFMPYFGGFPAYCAKCDEVADNDYKGFKFS